MTQDYVIKFDSSAGVFEVFTGEGKWLGAYEDAYYAHEHVDAARRNDAEMAEQAGEISPLVAEVRRHALNNYETGGWDYVVEAWTDADIERVIGKAKTAKGAISAVGKRLRALDDRRRDIMGA